MFKNISRASDLQDCTSNKTTVRDHSRSSSRMNPLVARGWYRIYKFVAVAAVARSPPTHTHTPRHHRALTAIRDWRGPIWRMTCYNCFDCFVEGVREKNDFRLPDAYGYRSYSARYGHKKSSGPSAPVTALTLSSSAIVYWSIVVGGGLFMYHKHRRIFNLTNRCESIFFLIIRDKS